MADNYIVRYSKRKSLSIEITKGLEIIVKAPNRYPKYLIQKFIDKNEEWIKKSIDKQKNRKYGKIVSEDEKHRLKKLAKSEIPPRVQYFSEMMGLKPTSVKITSAEKRFGSCSGKNGLCFSYRLMQYPQDEIDYVIVHEIAHIKHKNHGKQFYGLVEKYIPDYKQRQWNLFNL